MAEKLKMESLQRIPLLAGLSKADLKRLLAETRLERFATGATIVAEDDPGGRMFVIVEGLAKVSVGGRKRKTLGPGDHFGEISLLDKGHRSATVTAETAVTALSLTSWNFLALLKEHWSMSAAVLKGMATMIRELDSSPTR